jgi:hypothetical protein
MAVHSIWRLSAEGSQHLDRRGVEACQNDLWWHRKPGVVPGAQKSMMPSL